MLVDRKSDGDVACCHTTSVRGLIGRAAIEGNRTSRRNRDDTRPRGVVQDRSASQISQLERVAGGDGERVVPIFIDRGTPSPQLQPGGHDEDDGRPEAYS